MFASKSGTPLRGFYKQRTSKMCRLANSILFIYTIIVEIGCIGIEYKWSVNIVLSPNPPTKHINDVIIPRLRPSSSLPFSWTSLSVRCASPETRHRQPEAEPPRWIRSCHLAGRRFARSLQSTSVPSGGFPGFQRRGTALSSGLRPKGW